MLLEELACQFGLRTQDAIDRLQSLQDMERITGNIFFNVNWVKILGNYNCFDGTLSTGFNSHSWSQFKQSVTR